MSQRAIGVATHEGQVVRTLLPSLYVMFRPKVGRDLLVFQELSVDNGVTDLSVFVVRRQLIRRRVRARILASFTAPSQASIIASLTRFPALHKETLLKRSGLSPEVFQAQLKYLISAGAVRYLKKRDVFFLNPRVRVAVEDSTAIEAKTADWRTALYQATRYAGFAHRTFVALDSDYIHRAASHLDRFRSNRVGLIRVDVHNGRCSIIVSQTRRRPASLVSLVIANEKVFSHYVRACDGRDWQKTGSR